jgi:hypothetical protein
MVKCGSKGSNKRSDPSEERLRSRTTLKTSGVEVSEL